ncbi:MAG: hypothetical protein JO131_05905 [Gammaproteobacteria bacterium]|nr:hypothetical protein [Gammaproteobacteria bacterium]
MPYQVLKEKIQQDKIEILSDRQKEIISLMKEYNFLSTLELRDKLSFSPSERWVRDALSRLKKMGYIDVIGQTTTRKWFGIKK